jgi:hypothetical protein
VTTVPVSVQVTSVMSSGQSISGGSVSDVQSRTVSVTPVRSPTMFVTLPRASGSLTTAVSAPMSAAGMSTVVMAEPGSATNRNVVSSVPAGAAAIGGSKKPIRPW